MNREIQEKDEKQPGKWKRVGRFCLKYPVSILFALAMPSIVFTFFIDKKYRNILKNE